jgi:hypothetical protein
MAISSSDEPVRLVEDRLLDRRSPGPVQLVHRAVDRHATADLRAGRDGDPALAVDDEVDDAGWLPDQPVDVSRGSM